MWSLLIVACSYSWEKSDPRVVRGAPEGTETAETGVPAEEGETGEGPDSGETGAVETGGDETGVETGSEETGALHEVCYPGERWEWDACFPLTDWDVAWGEDYTYPDPYGGSAQYAAPARYVDLADLDPSEPVAPNFVLAELMSAEKGRYGLFQTHALEALQAIRDWSGGPLTVNSAYRNVSYNAGVDGATYSRHMYGDGADLVSSTLDIEEVAAACEAEDADYTQLYESHTHCDWRDDPLDAAFYDEAAGKRRVRAPRPVLSARLERVDEAWTAPATGFEEGEPLRRWTALDAAGKVLVTTTGRRFEAPAGTVRVRVVVGGQVRVEGRVDDRGGRL